MQYAAMVDLLQEAERAGAQQTALVRVNRLPVANAFAIWLAGQDPGEITGEEKGALRRAFEKGFGIRVHDQE